MIILINFSFSKLVCNQSVMKLDGEPFYIIGGELSPWRIPREYWDNRIKAVKAIGANTISVDIPWNRATNNNYSLDNAYIQQIQDFLNLCKKNQLFIYLRPGPYIDNNWDFGGFPHILLNEGNISIRSIDNETYKNLTISYIKQLKGVLTNQGFSDMIIAIELEYNYGDTTQKNHTAYINFLYNEWQPNFPNICYTIAEQSNNLLKYNFTILNNIAIGLINPVPNSPSQKNFEDAHKLTNSSIFVAKLRVSEIKYWGDTNWSAPSASNYIPYYLLQKNKDQYGFIFSEVLGGTNFGISAGSTFNNNKFKQLTTSYDNAAPFGENGDTTQLFFQYRNQIMQLLNNKTIPDLPKAPEMFSLNSFQLNRTSSLWDYPATPLKIKKDAPMNLEIHGQNQGYAIYTANMSNFIGQKGKLYIQHVNDYACVYINGYLIQIINRHEQESITISMQTIELPGRLEILVEGMGHLSSGENMSDDKKGVWGNITFNNKTVDDWTITLIPTNNNQTEKLIQNNDLHSGYLGGVYQANFSLNNNLLGDTFLDLKNFSKGIVYINGINIGRYWNTGPQYCMYVPKPFFREESNQIIIVEQNKLGLSFEVQFSSKCRERVMNPFITLAFVFPIVIIIFLEIAIFTGCVINKKAKLQQVQLE